MALILNSTVDLCRLLTPPNACVSLYLGKIDKRSLQQMELNDFEFAPVLAADQSFLGLVSRATAVELAQNEEHLWHDALLKPTPLLTRSPTMDLLLSALGVASVAVVTEVSDVQEGPAIRWLGLVTTSDLNKHYFRILIYEWLAELEVGLVRMIEKQGVSHESWIRSLSEDSQARILGYWHFSKMNGIDIGPLAACTLTDLTKIAGSINTIRAALDLSKKDFGDHIGRLPRLRNKVMHPVRPMITTPQELDEVRRSLESASLLISRITEAAADATSDSG